MSIVYQRESMEYVLVPATKDNADPGTDLTFTIAVVAEGTRPASGDFNTATWTDTTFTSGGKTYRSAKILVAMTAAAATGAQDLTLTTVNFPARFDVYGRVVDVDEIVVAKAGSLIVV